MTYVRILKNSFNKTRKFHELMSSVRFQQGYTNHKIEILLIPSIL